MELSIRDFFRWHIGEIIIPEDRITKLILDRFNDITEINEILRNYEIYTIDIWDIWDSISKLKSFVIRQEELKKCEKL
jgi:hypothetical protein